MFAPLHFLGVFFDLGEAIEYIGEFVFRQFDLQGLDHVEVGVDECRNFVHQVVRIALSGDFEDLTDSVLWQVTKDVLEKNY